jgi:3-phenylpropionate/trans-cinnamate dioxygenase ferredoxin reductase subunit
LFRHIAPGTDPVQTPLLWRQNIMNEPLVVVGASYAGLQIALSARGAGFDAPILLIGDEPHLPYQRPPLSKGFLTGKVAESALPIRPQQVLEQNRIEPVLGVRATAIDRASRKVTISDGRVLTYGRLALAIGCRPRLLPIPGADLEGVLYLRTLDDAIALKARMPQAQSVAIIGGGFIGLEIAASLAQLGKEVTVIEALPRVLARALPARVSDFLTEFHRRSGVTVRTGSTVRELEGVAGHVRSVLLSDGTRCPADFVIVGIGVLPNVELAGEAGLACQDGIVIDEFARTSDPTIVAAGDCTRHPNRFAPAGPIRLESVQNALDQAKTAGGAIVGTLKPYDAVPWFWSDQYDLKLQMVGLSEGHDQAVVRGSPDEQKFSVFYFRQGALIGIDSINRPGDHMAGRQLIPAGTPLTPEQAGDPSFDLVRLVAAARKAAPAPAG